MLEHAASEPPANTLPPQSVAEEISALELRLERGWEVISRAEARREPTDDLFRHFLGLLRQYEDLLDRHVIALTG